jgi:hypothetical protein
MYEYIYEYMCIYILHILENPHTMYGFPLEQCKLNQEVTFVSLTLVHSM